MSQTIKTRGRGTVLCPEHTPRPAALPASSCGTPRALPSTQPDENARHFPDWVLELPGRFALHGPGKFPLHPVKLRNIGYNDSEAHVSLEEALRLSRQPGVTGLGVCLEPQMGYLVLDIDPGYVHAETGEVGPFDEQGELRPWVKELLTRLSSPYFNVSPSGRGIHIWLRTAPGHDLSRHPQGIGIFTRGYVTFTGRTLPSSGVEPTYIDPDRIQSEILDPLFPQQRHAEVPEPEEEDHGASIEIDTQLVVGAGLHAKNGGKYRSLLHGGWEEYYAYPHHALMAACGMTRHWILRTHGADTGDDVTAAVLTIGRASDIYADYVRRRGQDEAERQLRSAALRARPLLDWYRERARPQDSALNLIAAALSPGNLKDRRIRTGKLAATVGRHRSNVYTYLTQLEAEGFVRRAGRKWYWTERGVEEVSARILELRSRTRSPRSAVVVDPPPPSESLSETPPRTPESPSEPSSVRPHPAPTSRPSLEREFSAGTKCITPPPRNEVEVVIEASMALFEELWLPKPEGRTGKPPGNREARHRVTLKLLPKDCPRREENGQYTILRRNLYVPDGTRLTSFTETWTHTETGARFWTDIERPEGAPLADESGSWEISRIPVPLAAFSGDSTARTPASLEVRVIRRREEPDYVNRTYLRERFAAFMDDFGAPDQRRRRKRGWKPVHLYDWDRVEEILKAREEELHAFMLKRTRTLSPERFLALYGPEAVETYFRGAETKSE